MLCPPIDILFDRKFDHLYVYLNAKAFSYN